FGIAEPREPLTCAGSDLWVAPRRDRRQARGSHPEMVLAAVEVVERVVNVPVEHARTPRHGEWPELLRDLAAQLDSGRIYPRDMPHVGAALSLALAAYRHLPGTRSSTP